jgi:hypothetical protein
MTQRDERERDDIKPKAMVLGDQEASYGSSYNESNPGEVEANREASLREQDEPQPDFEDHDR